MTIEKLEEISKNTINNLCGLVIKEGEKDRLCEICIKYNIPITYPKLFTDGVEHKLWGISKTGIGLIGIVIILYLSENNRTIFQSLDELEEYLEKK